MYREIHEYLGNFGDGIDTGTVTPYDQFGEHHLDPKSLRGAGVRLLCWLGSEIDNSTYREALRGDCSNLAKRVIESDVLNGEPEIHTPLTKFFVSEAQYWEALSAVYTGVVKMEIEAGDPAA